MGLYKLIAGLHNEGGVEYKVGDVVESEVNLEQALKGKFIAIPDAAPVAAVEPVEEEVEEVEVVEEAPKKKRRARKSK